MLGFRGGNIDSIFVWMQLTSIYEAFFSVGLFHCVIMYFQTHQSALEKGSDCRFSLFSLYCILLVSSNVK